MMGHMNLKRSSTPASTPETGISTVVAEHKREDFPNRRELNESDIHGVTGNRKLEFPQEGESFRHSVFGDMVCNGAIRDPGIESVIVTDFEAFFSDSVTEL